MKSKVIFIVNAYRFGQREKHSYTVAAYDNLKKAIATADDHCIWRGQKYACVVEKIILNKFDENAENYTEEVYRSKSWVESWADDIRKQRKNLKEKNENRI